MVIEYRVSISFNAYGGTLSFERGGFDTLWGAKAFLGSALAKVMQEWGKIDANGINVIASIRDGDGIECSFHDTYEFRCS